MMTKETAKETRHVRVRRRPSERDEILLEEDVGRSPTKPDHLKTSTPYLITLVARLQSAVYAKQTEKAPVSLASHYLLHELGREAPLSHSDLVQRLSIGHATVAQTLKRLERDGLVERSLNGRDLRQVRVRLTPAGQKLRKQLDKEGGLLIADISKILGPEMEQALQEALMRLAAYFAAARR